MKFDNISVFAILLVAAEAFQLPQHHSYHRVRQLNAVAVGNEQVVVPPVGTENTQDEGEMDMTGIAFSVSERTRLTFFFL